MIVTAGVHSPVTGCWATTAESIGKVDSHLDSTFQEQGGNPAFGGGASLSGPGYVARNVGLQPVETIESANTCPIQAERWLL